MRNQDNQAGVPLGRQCRFAFVDLRGSEFGEALSDRHDEVAFKALQVSTRMIPLEPSHVLQ